MSFYKIRPRSGTKAQWETANTILAEREIGYELPDGGVGTGVVKMKMGDGVTAWNELPYASYVPDVPNDKGLTEVWNSETSYLANDYVIYDNKVWQALISNNGQTPAEGTYWTQVSLKGLNEKYTELNNSLNINLSNIDNILTIKSGFIGYASNTSLEGAINKYINSMNPYVPCLIHGEQINGLPITSSNPNDVCIEIIILNKSTNSYRIIIYDNKSTDIYTVSRIDGEWKLWSKLNN